MTKDNIIEGIGWLSTIAFAFCTIWQAGLSIIEGNSDGLTKTLLIVWMIGEITGTLYGIGLREWPLIISYGVNVILVGIITYYKFKPRR